jgi:hypothetical protein
LRKTPDARKSISTFLSMLLMQYTTTWNPTRVFVSPSAKWRTCPC